MTRILAVLAVLLCTEASAVPIVIELVGSVARVDAPLEAEFSVGEPFVARYGYESTAPDENDDPCCGDYPLLRFDGTVGDYTFQLDRGPFERGDVFVLNDSSLGDQISVGGPALGAPVADAALLFASALFRDLDRRLLVSDRLPFVSPDLEETEVRSALLGFDSVENGRALVVLEVNSARRVPEPPWWWLLAGASIGVARRVLR